MNNDQSVIVNAGEQIDGAPRRHSGPDRDPEADPHPEADPTPKAGANATPVPVEGEENADEDVSFGG